MKKKFLNILSLTIIFAFVSFSLSHSNVYASDFDMTQNSIDIANDNLNMSMDMIMNQGDFSMNTGYDTISYANDTNFMNHDMDNVMNFFFDNMSGYDEPTNVNIGTEGVNALEEGSWTSSFNDYFNNNMDVGVQEIQFDDNLANQGNMDLTFDSSPELSNDLNYTEVDNAIDQLDNNTLPENNDSLVYSTSSNDISSEEILSKSQEIPSEPKDISID